MRHEKGCLGVCRMYSFLHPIQSHVNTPRPLHSVQREYKDSSNSMHETRWEL
jgi:hypothetical protein